MYIINKLADGVIIPDDSKTSGLIPTVLPSRCREKVNSCSDLTSFSYFSNVHIYI